MKSNQFDTRRNRLAEAYLLLVQTAESKTAAASQVSEAQDAATASTTQNQAAQPVNNTPARSNVKTEVIK